ncbi:MAG: mechanosensitive ion channel family protein [Bryobacterales bacterium]|nr:mechanosensitive ion channel family protein [Bryobacterales bacterium]
MITFQNGSGTNGKRGSELDNQIDQLRATVMPDTDDKAGQFTPSTAPGSAAHAGPAASGMIGQAETLIALTQKTQSLDETIDLTQQLAATIDQLRKPLTAQLRQISEQVTALQSSSASNDIAVLKATRRQVEALTRRHKLIVAALLPLSKQQLVLQQYVDNVERWRVAVRQRFTTALRELLIRIAGLALLLLAITGGVALWRRLTFRYVNDIQRRRHLMQFSRILAVVIIALVLLFDFANQLGELATVMGFAAAGIALALQNVILSLAGYFYVSGRYGIRVGDRVQISGINGDVLEIGLFKITLMELGSADSGHQSTGRIVVFPNSVVFQPNGSFSKQLPGSNFTWNELNLSLAPDCDYRLAERRLLNVVNEVFSHQREAIQHECRRLERDLNMRIEPPMPQSHLRLSDSGIEIMIRYPAHLRSAVRTSDEIARRQVDAIKSEPALKLVSQVTPAIQPVELDGLRSAATAPASSKAGTAAAANSSEVLPGVSGQGAAMAAAAAAGATVAGALVETGLAEQQREGVGPRLPGWSKG